jgi:hypothetical protein
VIQEAGCGAALGAGVSFKPIGVYFAVRGSASMPIDGSSVIGFLPDCTGAQCGWVPDPPPDGGTGDGGAG